MFIAKITLNFLFLQEFLTSIQRAEVEREDILRDIARKIFEKFDKS